MLVTGKALVLWGLQSIWDTRHLSPQFCCKSETALKKKKKKMRSYKCFQLHVPNSKRHQKSSHRIFKQKRFNQDLNYTSLQMFRLSFRKEQGNFRNISFKDRWQSQTMEPFCFHREGKILGDGGRDLYLTPLGDVLSWSWSHLLPSHQQFNESLLARQ